ncbi:hypothetical protein ASU33_18795 [Solirubrum puertoriconensis]|uniref:Uncharacterized protein n=1 Tax=Solirubrum puertoriconensis TaxID=1751427 RepID=A0A9X0HP95_SOLP1|nr:hypothetical protein ASU33_18795 [Solirubrum puertoriconensis]
MGLPMRVFGGTGEYANMHNHIPLPDLASSLALFDPASIWSGLQQLSSLQQRQKARAIVVGRILKRQLSKVRTLMHRNKVK